MPVAAVEPPHIVMKVIIISVGGRAPPAQKTPRPSAKSHCIGTPEFADLTLQHLHPGPVRWWSPPGNGRYHARLDGPNGGASLTCSRFSSPPTGSPPTASRADARGRTPVEPPAPEPLVVHPLFSHGLHPPKKWSLSESSSTFLAAKTSILTPRHLFATAKSTANESFIAASSVKK